MGRTDVVIFDLGGVLIDWNPRHLYRKMFEDHEAMEHFLSEICSPDWNLQMDAGKPFAEGIAELAARHPHERDRIQAYFHRWLEMIGGPIRGTVALLEELHAEGTPLYALSNWSSETFALVRHEPEYSFLDRFRSIFVSGELRMVKPHPAIFTHTIEAIGVPAGACLFIDDNRANIEAAEAAGIEVHHFHAPETLRVDLVARGLLT